MDVMHATVSFSTPEPTFHRASGFKNDREARHAQKRRALGSRSRGRACADRFSYLWWMLTNLRTLKQS